jgi:hypothetical protein
MAARVAVRGKRPREHETGDDDSRDREENVLYDQFTSA